MKDEWIAVSQFNCLICFPKTFDLSNHIKSNCVQKTRFQLTVPLPSQGVMKNLPDHRMHLEIRGYLKLTLKIIAFVNMHKAKVELLARKNVFVKKKHLKMAYFPLPESGFPDFWKALDAKLLTPGQLLGYS